MILFRGTQIKDYSFDGIMLDCFHALRAKLGNDIVGISSLCLLKEEEEDIVGIQGKYIKQFQHKLKPNDLEIIVSPPSLHHKYPMYNPTIWHTAWDGTKLDPLFLEYINNSKLIELWVPSKCVRNTISNNGVNKPCRILPHHVRDCYTPKKVNKKGFVFGIGGQWWQHDNNKKNFSKVIENFSKTFKGFTKDIVSLQCRITSREKFPHNGDDKIDIIQDVFSHEEMANWYRNLDVFINASQYEGFGLMPLEAMACGTPVISGNHSGMIEYLAWNNHMPLETKQVVQPSDSFYPDAIWYDVIDESLSHQMMSAFRFGTGISSDIMVETVAPFRMKHLADRLIKLIPKDCMK